jgi:hypothetical protein
MYRLLPLLLTALVASCDLTGAISSLNLTSSKTSSTSSTSQTSNGDVFITSFVLKATDNPTSLTSDVIGSIDNTANVIALQIPYSLFDNPATLTPTITTTSGATLNLSGAQDFQ